MSFFGSRPSTGGFGTQPTMTGLGTQQNTGGFGTQQQNPGGFGVQQNTTSGFGQQNTTGGFGTQQNTSGFGAHQNTSGFGTSTTTGFGTQQNSGFGAQNKTGFGATQPATSGFGFNQPQQQQSSGFGFQQPQQQLGGFGAQQQRPGGFSFQQQPQSQFQQQMQPASNPPIVNDLLECFSSFTDPTKSVFIHPFYNLVHPNDKESYGKPPQVNDLLYQQAQQAAPDENFVVAFALGPKDVQNRLNIQNQNYVDLENRVGDIDNQVTEVSKNISDFSSRIEGMKKKHFILIEQTTKMYNKLAIYQRSPLSQQELDLYDQFKDFLDTTQRLTISKLNKRQADEYDIDEEAVPVFYEALAEMNDRIKSLSTKIQKDMKSTVEMAQLLQTIRN